MNNIEKRTYKITLLAIKCIPMLVALCYGLNTLLAFFTVHLDVLGYLVNLLFIVCFYLLSYVFRFCAYHRMFIHYALCINIINIYGYYIGIPLSDAVMFASYLVLTIVAMFITLYLYVKQNKTHTGVVRGRNR